MGKKSHSLSSKGESWADLNLFQVVGDPLTDFYKIQNIIIALFYLLH